jgi:hypothetical protein
MTANLSFVGTTQPLKCITTLLDIQSTPATGPRAVARLAVLYLLTSCFDGHSMLVSLLQPPLSLYRLGRTAAVHPLRRREREKLCRWSKVSLDPTAAEDLVAEIADGGLAGSDAEARSVERDFEAVAIVRRDGGG